MCFINMGAGVASAVVTFDLSTACPSSIDYIVYASLDWTLHIIWKPYCSIKILLANHQSNSQDWLVNTKYSPTKQVRQDAILNGRSIGHLWSFVGVFCLGYGMTEVNVTHLNTEEENRYKAVGKLVPLTEHKVTTYSLPTSTIHSSATIQSLPHSVLFFCTCDKVYHKWEVRFLLYLLWTRSNCHLTIITPVNWIKIKQVLL